MAIIKAMGRRTVFLTMALSLTLLATSPAWSATEWDLLSNAGHKAQESENFAEAEKQYLAALKVAERPVNANKPYLADTLVALGSLSLNRDYAKAESFYKKALVLREKQLGAKSTKVAEVLEKLGYLAPILHKPDRDQLYARAEQIRKGAIDADQKKFGPASLELAVDLKDLAFEYQSNLRWAEAETLFRKAVAIRTKLAGPNDPGLAEYLPGLIDTLLLQSRYHHESKFADAETFAKRLLAIDEKKYGITQVRVLSDLHQLASIYQDTGNFKGALDICQRLLVNDEKKYGTASAKVAEDLDDIGTTYEVHGDASKADLYFLRADAIWKKLPKSEHQIYSANLFEQRTPVMTVAYQKRALLIQKRVNSEESQDGYMASSKMADMLQSQWRFSEAEPFALTLLALNKKVPVPNRFNVESDLKTLAYLCWRQNRFAEAEDYYLRALTLNESLLEKGHEVRLTVNLNSLALLYRDLGRFSEAESLLKRSLELDEKAAGVSGKQVGIARTLGVLGSVYLWQKKFKEAETAYIRSIALHKVIDGIKHPDTAHALNGLAIVYFNQGRYAKAKSLFDQARESTVVTAYLPYEEVLVDLNGLARSSEHDGNIKEAEKLYKRASMLVLSKLFQTTGPWLQC